MDQQKAVLKDTRDKQTKLEGQEKKLGESIIINKSKVDTAVDNIGLMQELVEQRVKAIKTLCEMLDLNLEIDMESQSLSVEDLSSSLHRIQRAIEDKEDELMMLRAEDCSKEDELQRKIDVVRDEKTAVDTNISTQRDRIRVLTTEHEKVKQEVTRIERSMPNLPQLATQIEAAKIELEKFKSENDVKDLEDERVLEELDKEDLDVKAEKMMCQVEKLESISKFTNEIELKQRELTRDENEFERTKNNQSNTLKQLFPGKKIEKNFKSTVQVFSDTLAVEVKEIKVDLHHAKMADSRLRTEREHLRKQYKIKEKECREANDKVRDTTYGADFMSLLATQQEKVSKLTMELAFQRSSKDMMSHYIDDIDTEPACPLCSKHLDVTDCSDLKEKIQEKIHQLPVRINDTDKKLKTESKRLHEISECKPTYDGMEKLEKDVKKLQLDLDEVEGKFRENSSKIEDLEMQIVEPESKQSMLNGVFVSDMLKLDDLTKGIARKAQEIKDLKAKLPGEMPEKSLDDSKNELRQLNVDIKSKSEVIKTLNFKINQIQSKLNQLQDKLNKMVGQKMEFQEKIQGLDQMRSQMKEKEKEKQKIEEKLKEDREKLQPMMVKLSNLSTQKETLKKEAEVRQKSGQETLNKLQNSQKDIDRQSKEVKSYEDMNWQQKLMECEKKIAEADENLKKLQTEKIKNSGDIQKYENEVRDQEGNKRNLMDNMELMKIQQQLKAAEEELKNLRKTIGDMDPRKVFAEKKELHETREKLNNERSMVSGQISESKNQITKEKKELSNPKYRDARKNYLCCCYDEAILTAMIGDFHKYQVALERGLLKFHSDKMVQINQSIRSYWNSIYKGNDIDYIMIKTDEEEQKATVSEKKRSYSYRVVQGKNGGSEIDMRGRCSAGQKVLASLIIRMALADTFAANCGILALDEPTTNLDQKNIQALCEALNKIIEERESIGNFMLLVITHDEEFVRVLQNVEDFFKLSRDPNGRSRIERITKE